MDNPRYVPIEDVAKYFSVSISTIRAWVRQNQIPKDTYIKIGNTYRFCVADMAAALTKQKDPDGEYVEEFQEKFAEATETKKTNTQPDLFENIDDDV